jgi:hypothetical protein
MPILLFVTLMIYAVLRLREKAMVDLSKRCELDSHADTCVAGRNALEIAHNDGRTVTVSPYTSEYAPRKGIRIASVAFLWEDPESGKGCILIVHEALYFGDEFEHSLLNPRNQIRDHGICVDDLP